jgi:hypothetical protein
MDDSSGTVWTIASVLTGAIIAIGCLMWTERRISGAWACFAASFFPMVIATIVWTPMSQNHFWKIAIPGTVGAIAGAILLIGVTQIIYRTASAQSQQPPQPTQQAQTPCSHGSDNTVIGTAPCHMGDGNTIINQADANGNVILNRGGLAVGRGACADSTSIAVGAGANAGQCAQPQK